MEEHKKEAEARKDKLSSPFLAISKKSRQNNLEEAWQDIEKIVRVTCDRASVPKSGKTRHLNTHRQMAQFRGSSRAYPVQLVEDNNRDVHGF